MVYNRRCAVPGCKSKEARFKFPKDPIRNSKWLKNLGMKSFGPNDYICINHFSNDQYYNPKSSNQTVRLFLTAVPHPMSIKVDLNVEIGNIFKNENSLNIDEAQDPLDLKSEISQKDTDIKHGKIDDFQIDNPIINDILDIKEDFVAHNAIELDKIQEKDPLSLKFSNSQIPRKSHISHESKISQESQKMFKCHTCNKLFSLEWILDKHNDYVHKMNIPHEPVCNPSDICEKTSKKIDHKEGIKDRKKKPKRNYKCENCDMHFITKDDLQIHILTIHKNENQLYKCDINECSMIFTSFGLQQHKKLHCDVCKKLFGQKSDLKSHIQKLHKSFCEICEEIFNSKMAKKLHMINQHAFNKKPKDTQLFCEICEETFKTKRAKTLHIRHKHAEVNNENHPLMPKSVPNNEIQDPLKSSKQCEINQTSKNELNQKPLQQNDMQYEFHCTMCGKIFKTKSKCQMHTNIKHNISISASEDEIDSDENIETWPCEHCEMNFETRQMCNDHMNTTHYFQKIRGIKSCKKFGGKATYWSHKSMLKFQNKYKNNFKINLAPPDFTKEMFEQFEFPKALKDLEVVPKHLSDIRNIPRNLFCPKCESQHPTIENLKQHIIKEHTLHYVCPINECDYVVKKSNSVLDSYRLARHIYYHGKTPPQLLHLHECIACGLKVKKIDSIEKHLKKEGPFHDNKCPKCPLRFELQADLRNHMKIERHYGFCCGICSEVFSRQFQLNEHQGIVHFGKPINEYKTESFVCEYCGKVFNHSNERNYHYRYYHVDVGMWPCDKCESIHKTKFRLEHHMRIHKTKPCSICGKILSLHKMPKHILQKHTKNHNKPYICEVCEKGFISKRRLEMHMNTHTGKKPFTCYCCGTGFAHRNNLRAHVNAHYGFKRQKQKKTANSNKIKLL